MRRGDVGVGRQRQLDLGGRAPAQRQREPPEPRAADQVLAGRRRDHARADLDGRHARPRRSRRRSGRATRTRRPAAARGRAPPRRHRGSGPRRPARPRPPAAAAAPAPRRSSGSPRGRRPRARPRRRHRARRGARPTAPPCTAGRPSRCRRRASARRPRSARAPRRGGASRRTAGAGSPRSARARTTPRPTPGASKRPPAHRGREDQRERRPGIHARAQPEHPLDLRVHRGLRHPPRPHRLDQRGAPRPARPRHQQIDPRARRRVRVPRRPPVGHHEPLEAPFVLQHLGEQGAGRHRHAVDPVVGGHDGPRPLLPHDRLERRQVELAQRPLPHPHVDRVALGLRVVRDEVLDGRADAAGLEPAHVGAADPRGQQRILREALEVAPRERRPVQVHGRRQQDVDALAPALPRQQPADPLDQRHVPRRRQRGRRRHVRRHVALVPALAAHARGPVRHDDPPQPGRGQRVQRPHVRAREQADLLLERERQYSRDVRHTVTQP